MKSIAVRRLEFFVSYNFANKIKNSYQVFDKDLMAVLSWIKKETISSLKINPYKIDDAIDFYKKTGDTIEMKKVLLSANQKILGTRIIPFNSCLRLIK